MNTPTQHTPGKPNPPVQKTGGAPSSTRSAPSNPRTGKQSVEGTGPAPSSAPKKYWGPPEKMRDPTAILARASSFPREKKPTVATSSKKKKKKSIEDIASIENVSSIEEFQVLRTFQV